MATLIGIRELQQHASRLVQDVEQGRAAYRVTVQGRETGVMLTKASGARVAATVTAAQVIASEWWQRELPDQVRLRMLAAVEEGRDAMGLVGE